mgnify:FL=1|nr:acyltransferase [uncultured Terrisporobacter sp.]
MLTKILKVLKSESKQRGLYYSFIMNLSQVVGMMRALFYKIIYFKNIKSSVFVMQSKSRIEIFNKKSKINIGKFVFIRKNTTIRIDGDSTLHIGDHVFMNDNCNINCANKISIGSYTKIAPNVSINDHDHNYKGIGDENLIKGEVIIGKNVWIGSNSVILRGTIIEDNAVVAAGSIVKGYVAKDSVFLNKRKNITKLYKEEKISS